MAPTRRDPRLSPVILAGGSGTRLWPMSRRTYPKHLIALAGARTLLQQCAERALGVAAAERVLTVGAVDQAGLLEAQLGDVDPALRAGLLLEPAARNTAAACAAAALHATDRFGPDQVLWVCAADHVMGDVEALYDALAPAVEAARDGRLVTFGISPTHPEPGFGYIRTGGVLADHPAVHDVAAFVEKPPRARAEAMLAAGGHLWNSGMFVFRAGTFLDELAAHAPAILEATRAAVAAAGHTPLTFAAGYADIPSAPVDKAVMEVSRRVAVVPCDPRWSDVGSWRAVWESRPRDARDNAIAGDVVLEDARGCLVIGHDRLVAAVGVEDLAIIDTPDAVMVARRDDAAAVKAVVEGLATAERAEASGYPGERAVWGERSTTTIGGLAVRELTLRPGHTLTVTAPPERALHLFGADLEAPVVLAPGEAVRLTAPSDRPRTFVEVEVPGAPPSTP